MEFNSLEELISYILNDIMKTDYERVLRMSFDDKGVLMFVFEMEIPIMISYHQVYDQNNELRDVILAEVYTELLRNNIGIGWLKELDEICTIIEQNQKIFEKLLKKGE